MNGLENSFTCRNSWRHSYCTDSRLKDLEIFMRLNSLHTLACGLNKSIMLQCQGTYLHPD